MPKKPVHQFPKSTTLPRKLPDDPIARGVAIMREATGDALARTHKTFTKQRAIADALTTLTVY